MSHRSQKEALVMRSSQDRASGTSYRGSRSSARASQQTGNGQGYSSVVHLRGNRPEKKAKLYDEHIFPVWSARFAQMLLKDLSVPEGATILDINCATGFVTTRLFERLSHEGRVVAIDPNGSLIDIAREKAGNAAGKQVFFRSQPLVSQLAFADEVYDLVVSNLGLLEFDAPKTALKEFSRVTKPSGMVAVTTTLAGTFEQFYRVYRQVLRDNRLFGIERRLDCHMARFPDESEVVKWMTRASLIDVDIRIETFTLTFNSSREFFFHPAIEHGPLSGWKEIVGAGPRVQRVFAAIEDAIDEQCRTAPFELDVCAACVRGVRPKAFEPALVEDEEDEPTAEMTNSNSQKESRLRSGPPPIPGSAAAEDLTAISSSAVRESSTAKELDVEADVGVVDIDSTVHDLHEPVYFEEDSSIPITVMPPPSES